jgi:hypothetical protein
MSRGSRPANEDDVANGAAWAAMKILGRSQQGRDFFRSLSPLEQETLHVHAGEERDRQHNGPTLT